LWSETVTGVQTCALPIFNSILDKVIIRPKSLVGVRLGVST
jgi:hypothetical protein